MLPLAASIAALIAATPTSKPPLILAPTYHTEVRFVGPNPYKRIVIHNDGRSRLDWT
jgi:hypothetical protein